MKKKWMSYLIVVLLIIPVMAFAQTPPPSVESGMEEGGSSSKGSDMRAKMKEKMAAEEAEMEKGLQLTDEQKKLFKENKEKHKEKMKALFDDLHSKRDALRSALSEVNIDEAKIKSLAQEVKSLQGQSVDLKVAAVFELKSILTPEQFATFQQKASEMFGKMKEHREKMKGEHKGYGHKRWDSEEK